MYYFICIKENNNTKSSQHKNKVEFTIKHNHHQVRAQFRSAAKMKRKEGLSKVTMAWQMGGDEAASRRMG